MTIEEQNQSLEQIKQWNNSGEFLINDRTYKLTGLSHQFRVEVLSIYSQIEANIIMGNYKFLQDNEFKKTFDKVCDNSEILSKLNQLGKWALVVITASGFIYLLFHYIF